MTCRLGRWVGILVVAALALPVAAGARLDDGNGQWAPGRALIKFDAANMERDGIRTDLITKAIEEFVRHKLDAKIVATLPLIHDAYTIEFDGDLETGLDYFAQLDRREHSAPWIDWAQPDYVAHLKENSGPTDPAYWPNDPLFWPRTWSDPNRCNSQQKVLTQTNIWPLDGDLRQYPTGDARANDPTPADQRPDGDYRLLGSSSINVLPVWDALGHNTKGRSSAGGKWNSQDLERSGIAIWDSGIGNNPDVAGQVADIVSVGRPQGENDTQLSIAYQDDPLRFSDRQALQREFASEPLAPASGVKIEDRQPRKALFPLDDVTDDNAPPTGCDGHGTEVASIAGGAANDRQGIAGVGWNVPLVGIRAFRPWDDGKPRSVADALQLASFRPVGVYDDTLIDQLAVAKALQLPVINMSFGEQLFARREVVAIDPNDKKHELNTLLVTHPAVVEALARAFTGDTTLGVASAGGGRYGSALGVGASLDAGAADAAQAPCGLRLLQGRGTVLLGNRENVPTGPPSAQRNLPSGVLRGFSVPGVNFSDLNLLCVTASLNTVPQLLPGSGSGDGAVDLTAPGNHIPAATRPGGSADPNSWYRGVSGTSFAAAEVSGAGALLREAAPGASMRKIAQALRLGARPVYGLLNQVRYGQLDVTCSALWLIQHAKEKWDLKITKEGLGAPADLCFKPSIGTYTSEWTFNDSFFDPTEVFFNDPKSPILRRQETGADLVGTTLDSPQKRGWALALQNGRLLPENSNWPADQIAFFPIKKNGLSNPVAPPRRTLYNFDDTAYSNLGGMPVSCPVDTELVDFQLRVKSFVPNGYVYASSDARDHVPANTISLNVAMVKPFFSSLVPNTIRVAITARCQLLAPGGG